MPADMTESDPAAGAVIDARWPFWPTAMRIHPLTMTTTDSETNEPIIEARLEFRDQEGDTMKAIGQVRIELHDSDPSLGGSRAFDLWNIDLRDLAVNARHYDDITETYLFRLELENQESSPAGSYLKVYVLSVDGRRFETSAALR